MFKADEMPDHSMKTSLSPNALVMNLILSEIWSGFWPMPGGANSVRGGMSEDHSLKSHLPCHHPRSVRIFPSLASHLTRLVPGRVLECWT